MAEAVPPLMTRVLALPPAAPRRGGGAAKRCTLPVRLLAAAVVGVVLIASGCSAAVGLYQEEEEEEEDKGDRCTKDIDCSQPCTRRSCDEITERCVWHANQPAGVLCQASGVCNGLGVCEEG